MFRNFGFNVYFAAASGAAVAGTTTINGSSYDLVGSFGGPFDCATAVAMLGALTSTQQTILKWQGCNDNSTWVDLVNTHQGPPADAQAAPSLLVTDMFRPQCRYIRPVLLRGTANAVLDGIFVMLYNAHSLPITTQDATVATPQTGGSGSQGAGVAAVPVNVTAYPVQGANLA
jgi:hypothetical protein